MKITIETIPHSEQRYPTVGDWFFSEEGNHLTVRVSDLGDWRQEALIGVHELVEVLLCKHQGMEQEVVDRFDIAYEKSRPENSQDEPGDDPKAPYCKQHCFATGVERLLAAELGVGWKTYEEKIESL